MSNPLFSDMAQAFRLASFSNWLTTATPRGWSYDWPHLRALVAALDRVTSGECKRLSVSMPPRHCKSETTTVRYAAYRLERNPEERIIIGCYASDLALRFSRKVRRIVEGRIGLAPDQGSVGDWETAAGGGVRAVGVGAGVTGFGASLVLLDDMVKSRDEAESENRRNYTWSWLNDDIYTRLEPGGSLVAVGTRWHYDDALGRIDQEEAEGGEHFDRLILSALSEGDSDPLGRPEGAALCPARYDEAALALIARKLGARSFSALYQQRPMPIGSELLRVGLIGHAVPDRDTLRVYQAWDLSISLKAAADYTVCATVGIDRDQNAHLLHIWRGKVGFNGALEQMAVQAAAWSPISIGIETVAYQSAAFEEANRRHMLPFRECKPTGDKVVRAQLLADRIDAGKVFANHHAGWWREFSEEAQTFPLGRNDDQVDAVVYALSLAAKSKTPALPTFGAFTRPVFTDAAYTEAKRAYERSLGR